MLIITRDKREAFRATCKCGCSMDVVVVKSHGPVRIGIKDDAYNFQIERDDMKASPVCETGPRSALAAEPGVGREPNTESDDAG